MTEIQTTKDQNRSLQANNQGIKEELLDTRKKYSEAYENYMATVIEKLEAERQNEAFMDRLKKQLLEKTNDFDLMRDKNSPQDIDTIRIKVQEELEIPHRERIMKTQNELQDQKSRSYELKRAFDVLKTDYEVMFKSHQREIGALKEQHEQVETKQREEMTKMYEREISPEKDEQMIRAQNAQLNELKHIAEKLREEVRVIRLSKDDLFHTLEQLEASKEESLLQLRVRVATADSDRLAAEHRLVNLTNEQERKESTFRTVKHEGEQLSYHIEELKKQLYEADVRFASQATDHSIDIQGLKQHSETDIQDLEIQVAQLQGKVQDREELLRRAQRMTTEIQLRNESIESEMRKSFQTRAEDLSKRLSVVEIELAEEKSSKKVNEYQSKQVVDELGVELEVQRSEGARLQREKEIIHQKLRDLEMRGTEDKKASSITRKENIICIGNMDKIVKESKIRINELEAKVFKAKSADLENQYLSQSLQGNISTLKSEQSALIEIMRSEMKIKLNDMEKLYIEKLEKIKENTREALDKERKRAEGYKSKAIDAQKRGKALSETALAAAAGSYGIDYMGVSQK
eukprot:CAMPEP_0119034002 /NCGR_PEP_ID=MMETSP1177-20130426/1063_1 /TAXON_ID=2985 /ORGANISM="Ochromonas sp, Strain CCMP1899" /LENGTH=574 /DNA_ID=CAMNT_0006991171 /DNA_START=128 /DNA_END=1852 /DNA_ORIENTATION=+